MHVGFDFFSFSSLLFSGIWFMSIPHSGDDHDDYVFFSWNVISHQENQENSSISFKTT